jgi:hypothetical protein
MMIGESETLSREAVRPYLLHSFMQVQSVIVPFTCHGKVCNYAEPKPFPLSQTPGCFDFSSSNFDVQDHILSTAGDALTPKRLLGVVQTRSNHLCLYFEGSTPAEDP